MGASKTDWRAPVFALLTDGTIVEFRPAAPSDLDGVRLLHAGLSEESRRMRFLGTGAHGAEQTAQRICAPPSQDYAALLAVLDTKIIGVAEYTLAEGPGHAEVAFAVDESYHHLGVGTLLLEHLATEARRHGVTHFVAYVLSENHAMHRVFFDAGLAVTTQIDSGVARLVVSLQEGDRYLASVEARELIAEVESLRPLLRPRSVVVVGAGAPVGRLILDRIKQGGFAGQIFAVDPEAATGNDLTPMLPSVLDLPEAPDLALVAVPADWVLAVVDACAARGIRAVVVLTFGLHKEAEQAVLLTCRRHGMRMVGPSSVGIAVTSADVHLDATLARSHPMPGKTAIAVQSGGIGIGLLRQISRLGIGLSAFVAMGESYDVSGTDLLQWWERDEQTDMAILELGSPGNPRKLGRILRKVARRKPVLALLGATGATREALFAQAGVIATRSLDELIATAALLAHQPLPAGNSVAIVGDERAEVSPLASDACKCAGLSVVTEGPADALLVLIAPTSPSDVVHGLVSDLHLQGRPLLVVHLGQSELITTVRGQTASVPVFSDVDLAARALGHVARYAHWRTRPEGHITRPTVVDRREAHAVADEFLAGRPDGGWLGQAECVRLLGSFGVTYAGSRRLPMPRRGPAIDLGVAIRQDEVLGPVVVIARDSGQRELTHKQYVGLAPLTDTDVSELRWNSPYGMIIAADEGGGVHGAAVTDLVVRVSQLAHELPQLAAVELRLVRIRSGDVAVADAHLRLVPAQSAEPLLRRLD